MKAMTCKEFDSVVHGLVRMELLDVTVRESALDHSACCANCSEHLAEAVALAEATEALRKSGEELQAPPSVETAVIAAFRNHHQRATWRRTFEWASIGAVAAMLLIFLWNIGGPSRGQSAPSPRKNVSSQSSGPLDAKGPVSSSTVASAGSPLRDGLAQPDGVEVADASMSLAYAASDFVPVPFTDGIPGDDPGMVVRVQLTRASLAQLGYPVAETPDEDLIRADVLVGEDGWPRGVKLVQ